MSTPALAPLAVLTEVERISLLLGDPLLVDHDELLDNLREGLAVKGREGDARGRAVHARHVHVGAEETHSAVLAAVRLCALEQAEGVVEHGRGGVEDEGLV